MNNDIETLYSNNLMFSEPILWKENISLYPVLFRQIQDFSFGLESLLYDPMNYEDITLATLPRLYFLTSVAEFEYTNNIDMIYTNPILTNLYLNLRTMLSLVLKNQDYIFVKKNNFWQIRIYHDDEKQSFIDINSTEFEELREIILKQNGCTYSDEFIHNDIKNFMVHEEKSDKNRIVSTNEDYMEAIMLDMNINHEQAVGSLTMRRFNRLLDKIISRENYKIQQTASMSGMVTFKFDIPHWLGKQRNDRMFDKYFKEAKQV
jgi:hypothetical protein